MYTEYGLQKEIQKQVVAEKWILNEKPLSSMWIIVINIFLKLNIVSYITLCEIYNRRIKQFGWNPTKTVKLQEEFYISKNLLKI